MSLTLARRSRPRVAQRLVQPDATVAVTWDPLVRQEEEADTTFLMDLDEQELLEAGVTGMYVSVTGASPWDDTDNIARTAGKFREGFRTLTYQDGVIDMPGDGILDPAEFTIELWAKGTADWSTIGTSYFLMIGGTTEHVVIWWDSQQLKVTYKHDQATTAVNTTIHGPTFTSGQYPSGQWVHIAATMLDGTLRLYINGAQAASATGIAPADRLSAALRFGGPDNKSAPAHVVSDHRVSRRARTPDEELTLQVATVVDVDTTETVGTIADLTGGLHTLYGAETETMAEGALTVIRTDKMINATPIKAGGVDGTHPTLGHSGVYSYDWQVVDRTFDYIAALGMQAYISIDATPQILGGPEAPFSGTQLTTARSFAAGYPDTIPNDFDAFATIVGDLVHHVTVTEGHDVPYWGVWNEPNGQFWGGTRQDYYDLYEAVAGAVKAIDSGLKVGGPESINVDPTWVTGLIEHCGDNDVPLDFVSWHHYSGDVADITGIRALVTNAATAAGIPDPELINGEWCWSNFAFPGSGNQPWRDHDNFINDWHAAFTATCLVEMQRTGHVRSSYSNPVRTGASSYESSGLMDATTPFANLNVFRMWNLLHATQVEATVTGDPGIVAVASKSGADAAVLLSSLHYQKSRDHTVKVQVPGHSGSTVTAYLMDEDHSNYTDAGADHQDLETISATMVDSTVTVTMKPRSAVLLVLS